MWPSPGYSASRPSMRRKIRSRPTGMRTSHPSKGARVNLIRGNVVPRAHFFPRPYVNSPRVTRVFGLAFVTVVAGSVARAERLRIEERDVHSGSHARSNASRSDGE